MLLHTPKSVFWLAMVAVMLSGCLWRIPGTTMGWRIVSESKNRLPMSLSAVLSDWQDHADKEQDDDNEDEENGNGISQGIITACVIPSRTVTASDKVGLVQTLLLGGGDTKEDTDSDDSDTDQVTISTNSKAVVLSNGIALGLCGSSSLEEVVQATVACQGCIIYYPSVTDLKQGEGLLDWLAPAMEQWLAYYRNSNSNTDNNNNNNNNKGCLVVVCDDSLGISTTQSLLETAAKPILEAFPDQYPIRSLQDVFGSVHYVTANQVVSTLSSSSSAIQTTPEQVMAHIKKTSSSVIQDGNLLQPSTWERKINTAPMELAAARTLTRIRNDIVTDALQMMQRATHDNTVLVPDFGKLCDATMQHAQEQFHTQATASDNNNNKKRLLTSTFVGQELTNSIRTNLALAWMDVLEQQLVLLQDATFATFRQALGKLRLGATLARDMDDTIARTMQTFVKDVAKLVPTTATGVGGGGGIWKSRTKDVTIVMTRRLQEFCHDRLEAAQASGQFKPVPRKGITIGLHWLLPKPFGNDFRQEPWLQHATDHMVYVPQRNSKITDVPPEAIVKTGDWRDQIVPSPAGRDMVFMQ